MDWFFWWALFAVIVGIGASARGRSGFGWFILAMLISPLLAVILLALMPSIDAAATASHPTPAPADQDAPEAWKTRACPFCAETIKVEASKCKHCGSVVEPIQPRAAPAPTATPPHAGSPGYDLEQLPGAAYDLGQLLARFMKAVPPRVLLAWLAGFVLVAFVVNWVRVFLYSNI